MKRLITGLIPFIGVSGVASAHTLAGDESVILQLDHQLLGSHHLPLTGLLIVGGIVAFRLWRNRSTD